MTDQGWGDVGQIPEGVDMPEPDREIPPAERALGAAAHDARQALSTFSDVPERAAALREYVRRFQAAWNAAAQRPRLTVDGTYGTNTRTALSHALAEPLASMPPVRTTPAPTSTPTRTPVRPTSTPVRPTSTPTPHDDAPPVWLAPAVALARWTENARAADSIANTKLRSLRTNAAWLAARTTSAMSGVEVGRVPGPPDDGSVATWARTVWERVQREGQAAQRDLARRSEGLIASAERALQDVRRQLDREVDTATREALTAVEAALTSILRPLSRGIATAVRPIGTGLVVVGVVVLGAYIMSGRKAA